MQINGKFTRTTLNDTIKDDSLDYSAVKFRAKAWRTTANAYTLLPDAPTFTPTSPPPSY